MNINNGSVLQISLIVSFLWAIIPIIQKSALKKMHWKVLLFFNVIFQMLLLISLFFKDPSFSQELTKITTTDILKFSLPLSIIGIIAISLYYNILSTKNTFDVIILTSTYFIGTIILNSILFKEQMTTNQIIATILVFCAVWMTTI